jgi:hypothetical protein
MIVRVKKNHFKIYILYNSVGVKEKFIIKHSFQSKNINVLIFKVHHKTSQKNLKLFFLCCAKKSLILTCHRERRILNITLLLNSFCAIYFVTKKLRACLKMTLNLNFNSLARAILSRKNFNSQDFHFFLESLIEFYSEFFLDEGRFLTVLTPFKREKKYIFS